MSLDEALALARGGAKVLFEDALKEAQKRWIAYRDAEFLAIDLIYGGMQGTMWRVAGFGQKVEFVKRRTVELLTYANDLAQTN